MTRLLNLFLLLFALVSCQNNDTVLLAYDEIHSLELFENEKFEILYNGYNQAEGDYEIIADTIFLNYESETPKDLTKKILINKDLKKLKSIDNNLPFCAEIENYKRKNN